MRRSWREVGRFLGQDIVWVQLVFFWGYYGGYLIGVEGDRDRWVEKG